MKFDICGFEHLHLHSDFSLLDGYGMVEEYSARAKQINQRFLCVSDHGVMGAVPRQIQACEENKISPIFACELYVNPLQPELKDGEQSSDFAKTLSDEEKIRFRKSYHLLAIAYNTKGYENLVKLSSLGWLRGFYYRPRINHEQILKYKEGIIFTSCCYNGEIGQAFERGGEDAAFQMVEKYIAMFRDKFYLELMLLDFKKQKPFDAFIIKAHDKYHIPLIVTNDCLVQGSLVLTDEGYKKIEDIQIGNSVLTHNNRFRRVEYVNKRCVNDGEKVYRVKAAMGSFAWELTGNHQVRVGFVKLIKNKLKITEFGWKRVDELTNSDYLIFPKINSKFVFSDFDLKHIDLKKIIKNYRVDEGRVGTGAATQLVLNDDFFVTHCRLDRINTVRIPALLPVDEDLLKIIGLYIAEGGLDEGNQISFGLHVSEVDEVNLIERYFGKFGINCTKYVKGNGIKVEFQSVVFRKVFESLCGRGCLNKTLPKINGRFFNQFSISQVKIILCQYYKGDGHSPKIHERGCSIGSVSKELIYDLSVVMNSFGIPNIPCVREYTDNCKHKNPNAKPEEWNDFYYLSFGCNTRVKFEKTLGYSNKELVPCKTNRGKRYIECDNCYATKVQSINSIEYIGHVYNLQVQEDESYVANMFQLHNCHYCMEADSWMQRLMLMVQTKTTLGDIQSKINENENAEMFELQDKNLWYKSEDEIDQKWFSDYKDIIDYDLFKQAKSNTVKICEMAKGVELDRSMKLPNFDSANDKLLEAIQKGVSNRGIELNKKYQDRIKEEYTLISQKGFSSYFLIQKMMADEARRVCPIILGWGDGSEAIGPGRGSVAGSLVAYLIGITEVDPLRHDLLFSRFLSPARGGKTMKLKFSSDPIVAVDEGIQNHLYGEKNKTS